MIQAENLISTTGNQSNPNAIQTGGFSSPMDESVSSNQPTSTTGNISSTNPNITTKPPRSEINPHRISTIVEYFFHWWHKIAVILLTIQGLAGLWESVKFIAIDYKGLEYQLEIHQVQTTEVNHLVARAIIVVGTTLVNIFMAVRLHKVEETTAHNIDLVIATLLIIGTKFIQDILIQFDLLNLIIN